MTRKLFLLQLLLIAAAITATAIMYPHLPDRVPVHWNMHGQVDGYGPRAELFFTTPLLMGLFMLLAALIPWLQKEEFRTDGWVFRQIMGSAACLIGYLHAILLAVSSGYSLDVSRMLMVGVCVFIAYIGNLMGKVRPNCTIGIRTPWTLASGRVWYATHRLAGKTYVVGGLIGALLFLVIGTNPWLMIVLTAVLIAPAAYSLVCYKLLEKRGELSDGSPRFTGN